LHDGDVRLTDEEQRIIASIEHYEREQRSWCYRECTFVGWWAAARRRGRRLTRWWTVVVVGTLVLGGGLVAGQPIVGLAGFVIVLYGISRPRRRMGLASWGPRFLRWIGWSAPGAHIGAVT
jgi:hypothetical protein